MDQPDQSAHVALLDGLEIPALMVKLENAEKLELMALREIADQMEFLERTESLDQGDPQDQPVKLAATEKTEKREHLVRMERMDHKDPRDLLVFLDKWELAVRRVNKEPRVKLEAPDQLAHAVPLELVETMDLLVRQERLDEMATLDSVENQVHPVSPASRDHKVKLDPLDLQALMEREELSVNADKTDFLDKREYPDHKENVEQEVFMAKQERRVEPANQELMEHLVTEVNKDPLDPSDPPVPQATQADQDNQAHQVPREMWAIQDQLDLVETLDLTANVASLVFLENPA